jgi:hypothetical protein
VVAVASTAVPSLAKSARSARVIGRPLARSERSGSRAQKETETGEWKYVISGEAIDERKLSVVAKFGASTKVVYILTVYAE